MNDERYMAIIYKGGYACVKDMTYLDDLDELDNILKLHPDADYVEVFDRETTETVFEQEVA